MRKIVPLVDWSVDEDETLVRLVVEGRAASYIAGKLGRSRSAVCGRAKRKGLKFKGGHSTGGKRAEGQAPKQRRGHSLQAQYIEHRRVLLALVPNVLPEAEETTTNLVDLTDLRQNQCKWPVGDPRRPGFGFCGASRSPGFVYCGHHARRAYLFRCEAAA